MRRTAAKQSELFANDLPFVEYHFPTEGNAEHLLAIIGEAPGAQEVKEGKPFVGRSGQLLEKNLLQLGIKRSSLLIANVFRYQPPQNKVDHFFSSLKAARAHNQPINEDLGKFAGKYVLEKYAGEIQNLGTTLHRLKPKAVITLGRTPLWALTGQEGILSLRGKMQSCRLASGIPVIPTYHPSYIIRGNWDAEPLFLHDLKLALDLANRP